MKLTTLALGALSALSLAFTSVQAAESKGPVVTNKVYFDIEVRAREGSS